MSIIQFKEANCKNCYKCIRSCPVKAISFKNEQARIVEENCMLCGRCLVVCPQNAKSVKDDVDKVKSFLDRNEKVYVSLAPSFVSAFNILDGRKVISVLKKLGFTHVEETAIGATQVSIEYDKLIKDRKMINIISTACPSATFLVQKYYPELVDQLAPVVSPMIAHAKMMREVYGPRIRVVFIGPCLAKKEECNDLQNSGVVDAVITFEELERWMENDGLTFDIEDETDVKGMKSPTSRFYPAPGGIIKTLDSAFRKNYRCISIDGVDRCMEVLDAIKSGELTNYFIEMNTCTGGCLGGPCVKPLKGGLLKSRERLITYIKKYSKEPTTGIVEDVSVNLSKKFIDRPTKYEVPEEATIKEILAKIGKYTKEQELNCGTCGYSTCREKAIAVYNNKAELHMCLPYMRERAESISNIIINTTPNAIFALNQDLHIQELNLAAQEMFCLKGEDACGKHIYDVLECDDFENVKDTCCDVIDKKIYYEKYDLTVEQSVIFVKEQQMVIAIIKDITEQEKHEKQALKVKEEAVEIAQKVIEKQMRVAQEIASLLGETTAETKVTLNKLKKSILSDT